MVVNHIGQAYFMTETAILEQASRVASLVMTLVRQLSMPDNGPADELPLGQLRLCNMLYDGPRSMSALSRDLNVSLSAMTQIADRLETAGLVNRVAEGSDRRIKCLQLTPQGENVLRARQDARVRRVEEALGQLHSDTRTDILTALETLSAACAANGHGAVASEPSLVQTVQ
jgi:DNA-binding MarR family transcriptional regulator